MKDKEKVKIIDEFLLRLSNSNFGSLPEILDGTSRVASEKETRYKFIENDLIKFDLVKVIKPPGTNETISGFGIYSISPKGLDLITSNKSSLILYAKGKKLVSDRTWDVIKLLIGFFLGILAKYIFDNLK